MRKVSYRFLVDFSYSVYVFLLFFPFIFYLFVFSSLFQPGKDDDDDGDDDDLL